MLAGSGNANVAQIFGNGLLDMTRLALSPPELWSSIFTTNKSEVVKAIDEYIQKLNELKRSIGEDHGEEDHGEDEISHTFRQGAAFGVAIRKLPNT
jgi:prephenate dehydrogenase